VTSPLPIIKVGGVVTSILCTRRAVRNSTHTAVLEAVIGQIVDAGRRGESRRDVQPWYFILIHKPERVTLADKAAPQDRYLLHVIGDRHLILP
jgi:nitroreductase